MRQLLLAAALGLVACAAGDPIGGSTTAQGPGSGGGSGDGGSGDGGDGDGGSSAPSGPSTSVSSTSGPATTSGSSTTAASSSSTGTPCEEDPCKLVAPQCGCAADEMCTLVSATERGCVENGTRAPGQACGGGLGDCEAGAICVYVPGSDDLLSCSRFCDGDLQCDGQGGLCAQGLSTGDQLCSENCDPVSSSGCAIAGTKCGVYLDDVDMRFFTACTAAGGGVAGDICDADTPCAVGFDCFRTTEGDDLCFEYCSSAAPECPGTLTCRMDFNPPFVVGAVTYGVCEAS
jgi:hypothetical protein